MNIDKKLVYVAYGNENIWLIKTYNNFLDLYHKGYRYITHFDPKFDTLYELDENGDYKYLHGVKFSEIAALSQPNLDKSVVVVDLQEIMNLVHDPDNWLVYWKYKNQNIEITKGSPLYEFCYRVIPTHSPVYNIYAAPIEVTS